MIENPYAAPQNDPTETSASSTTSLSSPYGAHYRNINGLRLTILILLGLGAAVSLIQIYILLKLTSAQTGAEEDNEDRWVDFSHQLLAPELVLFFSTVVVWCIWKNKSCKNAWLFRSAGLSETALVPLNVPTPGWATGSYFIPILSLWKPFQAMAFIRNEVSSKINIGPLVGIWWTAWIIMNFTSRYFTRNADDLTTYEEVVAYNEGLIIEASISIVASILAAAVIHKLSEGQRLTAKDHGLIE